MSEPTEVVGKTHTTIDPNDLPSGTCFGFDNPWGHDLNLMPIRSGMSIYDELRYLEKRSYNEKIKMWKRKQAAVVAEENRRKKRAEQRNLATLYGTGDVKSKVMRYLKRSRTPWVRLQQIANDIQHDEASVRSALRRLEAVGLIAIYRKSKRTFVRLVTQNGESSTPLPPENGHVTEVVGETHTVSVNETIPAPLAVTNTSEPTPTTEVTPTPTKAPRVELPVLELPVATKSDRILKILKDTDEWVLSTELVGATHSIRAMQESIRRLRHRGHSISTRTIRENGKSQCFYRLNKFPHP